MPLRIFSMASAALVAFMVGADAGGEIAVQVPARQKRRVAVDMTVLEGLELRHADRILVDHAGEVHEFGKADNLRVGCGRVGAARRQIRARRLQMRRRHAGGQLDANIHDRLFGRIQEELDASVPSTLAISCGSQITVVTP